MKLGIIGKPQCGKTTIFNAVAGQDVAVGDFSQAVHRAIIKVPDERVDRLAEMANPKKITYAEIEFLDAAGFSGKGKQSGEIEIHPDLRMMEALVVVADAFSPDADPAADLQNIIDEMILADHVLIDSNLDRKKRRKNLTGDRSLESELALLGRCRDWLEDEKLLIGMELGPEELLSLRGFAFLTQKPLLFVVNIDEDSIDKREEIEKQHAQLVVPGHSEVLVLCGKIQMELAGLAPEDRMQFLEELGIAVSATDRLVQKSYDLLGLISFLTEGAPEVRAWTIAKGTNAQKAAGVIHSDIERGFIRAEVTSYADQIEYKTAAALKAAGKTRLEGKQYVVADGDVILFRFNV